MSLPILSGRAEHKEVTPEPVKVLPEANEVINLAHVHLRCPIELTLHFLLVTLKLSLDGLVFFGDFFETCL
jgi:hypothetical protein